MVDNITIDELILLRRQAHQRDYDDAQPRGIIGVLQTDGSYIIRGAQKRVYVTMDDGTINQATCSTVTPVGGAPVLLRQVKNKWTVVGTDPSRIDSFSSNISSSLEVGEHNHRRASGLAYVSEAELFEPGLVVPDTVGGLNVKVYPFFYRDSSGTRVAYLGEVKDLTSALPSNASEWWYAIVAVDKTTNAAVLVPAPASKSIAAPLMDSDIAAITLTSNQIPLMAIRLRTGQTSFTDYRDFRDAHEWFVDNFIYLASPGPIGGTTPGAGTFTTLIATLLKLTTSTVLTIATGVVTATQSFHRIDTEASAASDDLDTINGGAAGYRLVIRASNTARTVVVKYNTGNIQTFGAADISLDETYKFIELIYDGDLAKWVQIGGSVGGGSVDASAVTYTPSTLSDWTSSADPGNADAAFDQLASRETVAEAAIASLTSGGITSDGWVSAGETWTYAAADSPTFTFTIAGVDKTTKYSAGMRIRVSQATGGTKYFIITKVAFSTDTTITIYGGTAYTLNNQTISTPYFSVVKAPFGFPLDPTGWTVRVTDSSNRSQSTPVSGTWYNPGTLSITIPIGAWYIDYQAAADVERTTAGTADQYSALSTANNSQSDAEFTAINFSTFTGSTTTDLRTIGIASRRKTLVLTSKTQYFLIAKTTSSSISQISFRGDLMTTVLQAVCAYL